VALLRDVLGLPLRFEAPAQSIMQERPTDTGA
jgi:hypothetical protein